MARFGVKEVADVTFYNLLSGEPELFLDTLKMSNLENNAESTFATGGKGAPRLIGWDFNRTSTFTIQDALLNPKAIAMQTGTDLVVAKEKIYKREVLLTEADEDGTNSEVTLSELPIGDVILYPTTDGYAQGERVKKGSVVLADKVASVPVAELEDGVQVIAYYQYETEAEVETITIKSDKFAGFYKVIGDTLWRNEATGQDEMVQIVIPKAKISSQFTLTMQPDGEPSVFDFNLDVYKEATSTDMVKIVKY